MSRDYGHMTVLLSLAFLLKSLFVKRTVYLEHSYYERRETCLLDWQIINF